jgi:serine/threonine-protein kinase HipA
MKKTPTLINVHGEADGKSILLGQLGYDAKRGNGAFQWSNQALIAGVEWSPINLPLSADLWMSGTNERELFGLPGLIHDALPDGWGMLLINRAFNQRGITPSEITPLLRLAFLADRCWGALRFEPEWMAELTKKQRISLEIIAAEAQRFSENEASPISKHLLMAGGSPHGARPKIMVAINDKESNVLVGQETLPHGYRHVLIKFAAGNEPKTHPLLEYHYTEAARKMSIHTMPARLLQIEDATGVCFDRFDRQNGQRQHVHSMAGMLHTTHRIGNSDWTQVSDILRTLPGGEMDLNEAFRRAVFNCVFSVRDDHTKNISFIRNKNGMWGLAPAYDICYSPGPGGWHTMTYAGHGGPNVERQDLLRLAESFNVEAGDVSSLIEETQQARADMIIQAKLAGVVDSTLKELELQFKRVDEALASKPVNKAVDWRRRNKIGKA